MKETNLRTPKGTSDLDPNETLIKKKLIKICEGVFIGHCGLPIETPTFELRENLYDKYGEDTKLIYNLEDQKGDICSLRYDFTVPLARYLSKSRITNFRRYQIGSVFRRDSPSLYRSREFTQADFDLIGNSDPSVDEAEILTMINDILREITAEFGLGPFLIKINDRRILFYVLRTLGIPSENISSICSTIDKIEKLEPAAFERELRAKALSSPQIESLNKIMRKEYKKDEMLCFLQSLIRNDFSDQTLLEEYKAAVSELRLLVRYLGINKVKDYKIDLSLARGLSYYTGLIFEATFANKASVSGGGRYNNLCSTISTHRANCIGFSIGVSRILSLVKGADLVRREIFIGSAYGPMVEKRMELFSILNKRFAVENNRLSTRKFKDQVQYAKKNNFRFLVLTGEKEAKEKKVNIIKTKTNEKICIDEKDVLEYFLREIKRE